ncbi:MAG: cobalamin biosynthesis protein CbiA [candidate division Zixibacteria bacterium]|nr:cobalamin biosynthesis protein CbiA [candidate division Zixibacteria bacterium]
MMAVTPRIDFQPARFPSFSHKTIIIVGGFGSGKSEVSVNLARDLSSQPGDPVAIADLDIINPYFRSREAAEALSKFGVTSLIPFGEHRYADLPIIIPEIRTAIERRTSRLVLDVGGDDLGARVLSSLADSFGTGGYELLLVHNARRPFTSDLNGSLRMINEIESASRMKITGLIANTHLAAESTAPISAEGVQLTQKVADTLNMRVAFVSALSELCPEIDRILNQRYPILPLDRELLKPWETKPHPPTSMTRKRGG